MPACRLACCSRPAGTRCTRRNTRGCWAPATSAELPELGPGHHRRTARPARSAREAAAAERGGAGEAVLAWRRRGARHGRDGRARAAPRQEGVPPQGARLVDRGRAGACLPPCALVRDVAYAQLPRAARAGEAPPRRRVDRGHQRPSRPPISSAHHYLQALELAGVAGANTETLAPPARAARAPPATARSRSGRTTTRPSSTVARSCSIPARTNAASCSASWSQRLRLRSTPMRDPGPKRRSRPARRRATLPARRTPRPLSRRSRGTPATWTRMSTTGNGQSSSRSAVGQTAASPARSRRGHDITCSPTGTRRNRARRPRDRARRERRSRGHRRRRPGHRRHGTRQPGRRRGTRDSRRRARTRAAANAPVPMFRALNNSVYLIRRRYGPAAALPIRDEIEQEVLRRYGMLSTLRWFDSAAAWNAYQTGDWDESLRRAESFWRRSTQPHRLEVEASSSRRRRSRPPAATTVAPGRTSSAPSRAHATPRTRFSPRCSSTRPASPL